MQMLFPLVIAIICGYLSGIGLTIPFLGPATLRVDRLEECEEPDKYTHPYTVTMSRVNRTHNGITGCYNLTVPMDDKFSIKISGAIWGDGGWKPEGFVYFNENACDVFEKKVPKPFRAFLGAIGVTDVNCPIEKGFYCADHYVYELHSTFPSMLYGTFRIDIVFASEDVPFACFRVYAESSPSKDAVNIAHVNDKK